jgi:hypothetical protein
MYVPSAGFIFTKISSFHEKPGMTRLEPFLRPKFYYGPLWAMWPVRHLPCAHAGLAWTARIEYYLVNSYYPFSRDFSLLFSIVVFVDT